MLSRDELAAWLRLAATPGISRATARRLLAALGSAERVLAADPATLAALAGPEVVPLLKRHHPDHEAVVCAIDRWLAAATPAAPRDIIVLGDPRSPELLVHTADPPLLLFTLGRVALLSAPSVA